jgi:hypothetical protein
MPVHSEPPRLSVKISIEATGKETVALIRRPFHALFLFALIAAFATYGIPRLLALLIRTFE